MTMNRITDESLNQLIAIESLASDNAGDDKRQADQIYHSNIVSALEELRDCRNSAASPVAWTDGTELREIEHAAVAEMWGKPHGFGQDIALYKAAQAEPPIVNDVVGIIALLHENEWADHCTKTALGQQLEYEITRLINKAQANQKVSHWSNLCPDNFPATPASRDLIGGCHWLDWNQLSALGLIVRVNKEILHPMGLALFRDPESGVSDGALIAPDGKWHYADDIEKGGAK
ncbi:DUF7415 domain-containing protein [Citrobacter tructae]|uniref:DUF7415 domain-containing protein n=1 Tax=Citrobacter tructae TaxID=2562449 RepID=UPI003F54C24E